MYSTVKYTNDTRDSRKEKLEWKIRRNTVGYNVHRIHWILRHFTMCSYQICRESGLVIWMNYAQNQILKRHGFEISTENRFNDTGNAYNTRKSIWRNCAIHQIDDVILM